MKTTEATYYRPIVQSDALRPKGALALAGGPLWFTVAERMDRDGGSEVVPCAAIPDVWRERLSAPRPPICGLDWQSPRLIGVLNVTPDSFSDGGRFAGFDQALAQAGRMIADGADIIDVGGESTRPGAQPVPVDEEIARTVPVIVALRGKYPDQPISIDTRKAAVAKAAIAAGATLFNDVTALSHDKDSLTLAAEAGLPVCLMHTGGDPKTMQDDPRYGNILLDVYDYLAGRVAACERAGIPRPRLIVDPGIGFGKTVAHNLALIRGLSLFHGLGCVVMLGVSRKRLIGTIADVPDTDDRLPGSLTLGLGGLDQGAQILRVHDVAETRQAARIWQRLR